jgi:S1-C subfamily serine protease
MRNIKVVHGQRYRIALLAIAVAIIAVGVAVKPKEKPQTPISELESARLRRLTQERRLQDLGEYISYAAVNAAKALVYVPEVNQTAVAIDGHTFATGVRHIAGPVTRATSSARAMDVKVQARRPDVPVLFMQAVDNVPVYVPPRAEIDTGDWVIAVALRDDATPLFAYGLYEHDSEARCGSLTYNRLRASIPLTGAFVGGGLFSLRGALAGIIARCGPEVVVLSVSSVADALKRPVPANDWLQDRYGLRVEATERDGLRVIAVWKGTPSDAAGIAPGDEVVAIDGRAATTPEAAVTALQVDVEHEVAIKRGRRSIRARLDKSPPAADVDVPSAGFALLDAENGALVRSVRKDGAAARAGLLPGDIIVRYGSTPAKSAAAVADALERTGEPPTLTVERAGATFEARLLP